MTESTATPRLTRIAGAAWCRCGRAAGARGRSRRAVYGIGASATQSGPARLPARRSRLAGRHRAAGARRSGRARGRRDSRCGCPISPSTTTPAASILWPIGAAAPCCSTCGPPGACPAARRCRRSMRSQRKLGGAKLRGRRRQHRHPRSRQAARLAQGRRHHAARLLRRPERQGVSGPQARRPGASACRRR